jgi:hypothetical protein
MQPRVPAIRLKPSLLPDAIRIIATNEGDRKMTDLRIHEMLIRASKRPKPPDFVAATRAVTYPTLRHLGLAFGDGDLIRLTASGDVLNESLRKNNEQFSITLATHLLKWDRSNIQLLEKVRELSTEGSSITVGTVANRYWPDDKTAASDLRRLLAYFEAANLLTVASGVISINRNQVEAVQHLASNPVNKEEFVKVLLQEYSSEVRVRSSPAIPIPILERRVCRAFHNRLWPDEFRTILASLPKETESYVIHFGQPMVREGQGLRIGRQYFYYIQIHRKPSP